MKSRILLGGILLAGFASALAIGIPSFLMGGLPVWRPDIRFSVPADRKEVFITIDDAPSTGTGAILAVLKKHAVPAIFFVTSDRVQTAGQLDEIVRAGHSLGNHLRSTMACSELSFDEFKDSFDACATVLSCHGGAEFFRPASDLGTRQQMEYVRSKGLEPVMGTAFPLDHWIEDPDWLVRLARWLTKSGGIVILHDGERRSQTTATVLDRLIPELRAAGYSFGRLEKNRFPQ